MKPTQKPDFALQAGVLYPNTMRALQFLQQYYLTPDVRVGAHAVKSNFRLVNDIESAGLTIVREYVGVHNKNGKEQHP